MVFSLFTKKPEPKKSGDSAREVTLDAPRSKSSNTGNFKPGSNNGDELSPAFIKEAIKAAAAAKQNGTRLTKESIEAQKEVARLTAEKINKIESEMISANSSGIHLPKTLPQGTPMPATNAKAIKPSDAGGPPSQMADSLTRSTSVVLGDSADANAIDVIGSTLPSILEEAAILYSNAQAEPAKLTLLAAIDEPLPAGYATLGWLMLFDFYQLNGDRAAFDSLAMDYAARFEASPPGWKDNLSDAPAQTGGSTQANFVVPAHLDDKLKSTLQTLLKAAANKREVKIDFGNVKQIDLDAAGHLVPFFKFFAAAERPIIVLNAGKLAAAASVHVEAGRKDENDAMWQLTLTCHRLLGNHQAFDDLSIDYCVTYEVSPPAWEPMPLWVRGEAEGAAANSSAAASENGGNAFAFKGEMVGAITHERQALKEFVQNRREVTIDCRKLKRLDFSAAGELLNEVMNMRNANRSVLFVEPNYLVYTLMMVMGLHEVAEVRTRKG